MRERASRETVISDPVAAYDAIAASYDQLAARRGPYLAGIDRLIAQGVPAGSRSLLDIGAGDGRRGLRLATARGIRTVVLVEPSAGMRASHPRGRLGVESLPLRAEDLRHLEPGFDVIVCLWNVLGHVAGQSARIEVLRQCGRLLTPRGRIFIDLSHRYNTRHYGLATTAARYIGDHLWPRETRGDVVVAWHDGPEPIRTFGHVFTDCEIQGMCQAAGLAVEQRFVIDYATGREQRRAWQGHLLFVLRHPATAAAAADVVTCPQAALA
jgi:2-polyprenyl-3-methyl-5-hydroxy-6-metoxy-1,4-benzoquinol methylase